MKNGEKIIELRGFLFKNLLSEVSGFCFGLGFIWPKTKVVDANKLGCLKLEFFKSTY